MPLTGLPRQAQRTERLQRAHAALGFSVGAEAASALSRLLHIPTSPDSLLRSMKRQPLPVHPTPRVLGVDDWAIRKGLSYLTSYSFGKGCLERAFGPMMGYEPKRTTFQTALF